MTKPLGTILLLAAIIVPQIVMAQSAKGNGLALAKNWCNACHVVQKGDTSFDDGEVAPPFSDMKTTSRASLSTLLRGGHGQTPALSALSQADMDALADHIATQSRD